MKHSNEIVELYTIKCIELIDAISNVLFPPNDITNSKGEKSIIKVSDAKIDRYILMRAAWQPDSFGYPVLESLKDILNISQSYYQKNFTELLNDEQNYFIEKLEKGEFNISPSYTRKRQKEIFRIIHQSISEGLFSDPGYGGNDKEVGWFYSNFKTKG